MSAQSWAHISLLALQEERFCATAAQPLQQGKVMPLAELASNGCRLCWSTAQLLADYLGLQHGPAAVTDAIPGRIVQNLHTPRTRTRTILHPQLQGVGACSGEQRGEVMSLDPPHSWRWRVWKESDMSTSTEKMLTGQVCALLTVAWKQRLVRNSTHTTCMPAHYLAHTHTLAHISYEYSTRDMLSDLL